MGLTINEWAWQFTPKNVKAATERCRLMRIRVAYNGRRVHFMVTPEDSQVVGEKKVRASSNILPTRHLKLAGGTHGKLEWQQLWWWMLKGKQMPWEGLARRCQATIWRLLMWCCLAQRRHQRGWLLADYRRHQLSACDWVGDIRAPIDFAWKRLLGR